jgi:uncharacterized membrane protein
VNRALWLLLGLRLYGWLRRVGRSLGSVRGALLVAAGALVFLPWVLTLFLSTQPWGQHTAEVRRYGPLVLAAYCLVELVVMSERALTFSAAEVNFLFPAPLSRRQVLAYKVTGTLGSSLLSAALLTLFLRHYALNAAGAVVGLLLAVLFLQLFPMVLTLLATTVGARAYNRRRKVVLLLLAALAAAVVLPGLLGKGQAELLDEVEASPVAQTLLAPFRWFVQAFTAERLWPDLAIWAGLGLLANGCLLVLVFALDAQYLESAAVASERAYERLQQLRRGGPALALPPASGRARVRVPGLPAWGGVGAVAWRQLVTALRTPWSLFAALVVTAMLAYSAVAIRERPADAELSSALAVVLLFGLALFIPPLLPFDFRADLDRMDLLKTLPLPAWRLVVGQLLVPVLLASALQALFALALLVAWQEANPLLLAGVGVLLPVNFLVFALDNLLFLWFPSRHLRATPGDLQALGRQMVLWVVKLLALGLLAAVAAVAGVVVYLETGQSVAAGVVAGWVVLTGLGAGLVPLVALALRNFDVARDTP